MSLFDLGGTNSVGLGHRRDAAADGRCTGSIIIEGLYLVLPSLNLGTGRALTLLDCTI
jgi:hypothetical protein